MLGLYQAHSLKCLGLSTESPTPLVCGKASHQHTVKLSRWFWWEDKCGTCCIWHPSRSHSQWDLLDVEQGWDPNWKWIIGRIDPTYPDQFTFPCNNMHHTIVFLIWVIIGDRCHGVISSVYENVSSIRAGTFSILCTNSPIYPELGGRSPSPDILWLVSSNSGLCLNIFSAETTPLSTGPKTVASMALAPFIWR